MYPESKIGQHTPGPWKADKDSKGGYLVYQYGPDLGKSGNAEDCPPIAEVLFNNNAKANAQLIAAVPELLALLKSASELLLFQGGIFRGNVLGLKGLKHKVDQMIKKAEGR